MSDEIKNPNTEENQPDLKTLEDEDLSHIHITHPTRN